MVTCAILHWMKYVARWKINIVIAISQSCVMLIALLPVRLTKLSIGELFGVILFLSIKQSWKYFDHEKSGTMVRWSDDCGENFC